MCLIFVKETRLFSLILYSYSLGIIKYNRYKQRLNTSERNSYNPMKVSILVKIVFVI